MSSCREIIEKLKNNPAACVVASATLNAGFSALTGAIGGNLGAQAVNCDVKTATQIGALGGAILGASQSLFSSASNYLCRNKASSEESREAVTTYQQAPGSLEEEDNDPRNRRLAFVKGFAYQAAKSTAFSTLGAMIGYGIVRPSTITLGGAAASASVGSAFLLGGGAAFVLGLYLVIKYDVAGNCVDAVDKCGERMCCDEDLELNNRRARLGS